ncbi:MAG: RNA polymerase subunit sigma-70, partial [Terriglobia bacterium]
MSHSNSTEAAKGVFVGAGPNDGEAALTLPDRFALMYEKHVSAVFRYAYYRTHDRFVAEDLTSQIFEKALR